MVACGVRKVWSKEFKDLDKPSDQIRRLRQILTDLGMTGRMSMEQAKAIKQKREFEKELGAPTRWFALAAFAIADRRFVQRMSKNSHGRLSPPAAVVLRNRAQPKRHRWTTPTSKPRRSVVSGFFYAASMHFTDILVFSLLQDKVSWHF